MARKPVTVSQLNEYIARVMETDPILGSVLVKGEISGIKYHSSGHVYFTVMDGSSRLSCFLPSDRVSSLHYTLDNGMEVILSGVVRVYKKGGSYSLNVYDVEVSGEGSLAIAFEKMKSKLDKEGLFAPEHKKPIPAFPHKVGVITSETGAAVRDILKIIKQRNDYADVTVFPVLVQGDKAAGDISSMIDYVNREYDDIDVLIVGRGGGSPEDLWAFNEEIVARSIYKSHIPVISAVGHEIDFTISDFTADRRAETPTAAAQMAVPDTNELRERLDELKFSLFSQLQNKLQMKIYTTETLFKDLNRVIRDKIEGYGRDIEKLRLILDENNPLGIMENGYSVLTDSEGHIMSSAESLKINGEYNIMLRDGSAKCRIIEVNHEKDRRN